MSTHDVIIREREKERERETERERKREREREEKGGREVLPVKILENEITFLLSF